MPGGRSGWQYFRPRVEGSFQRFFWSPSHKTWLVQDKSGVTLELGVPQNDASYVAPLETDPQDSSHIFRWNLSRQYDAHLEAQTPAGGAPRPVNVVVYRYLSADGEAYLSDIYDTPPAANAAGAAPSEYAHHTRLAYEERPDVTTSFRRGWQTKSSLRLSHVDVASEPFAEAASARRLVRRYHLAYDPGYHVSLLTSVQVEGRRAADESSAPSEDGSASIADSVCTSGTCLPPMTFDYQHVAAFTTSGQPGKRDLEGYEGFDERVRSISSSPDYSVDEELTDLFDINADGLPDVLVTAAGFFGGKHGVYFNGSKGIADSFGEDTIAVAGVLGADVGAITLKNLNLSALDIDGDGIIDLLHMPIAKSYAVYTPQKLATGWTWSGRAISTASQQNPKIDFGRDTTNLRVTDVNGDGLVDVVLSTGTEFQTFFSLGRYPGGDGQFGAATRTSATAASLSNDPVRMCVPYAGQPVQFSDAGIKLADMNGDGLVDIVKMSKGDIRYWPGRGNGLWGTGALDTCAAGTFGQGREIAMAQSPEYSDINGESILFRRRQRRWPRRHRPDPISGCRRLAQRGRRILDAPAAHSVQHARRALRTPTACAWSM